MDFNKALEKMWDTWMASQGYDSDRRAMFRQQLRTKVQSIWLEKSWRNDVQELNRMQCPRLMMQFVIQEGMIRSYASLPEEWRVFLDFLQVKTQPMLATPLRQTLLESQNDLMWVGMLEELLAEVCPGGQQAPISQVSELVAYVKEYEEEMRGVVVELHGDSPTYQNMLADLTRLVANNFNLNGRPEDK